MEKNLKQFSETYAGGLWIATGIFLLLFLVRLYFVFKYKASRHWITKTSGDWYVLLLKVFFLIGILAFLADIPAWFFAVAVFRPVAPEFPFYFFILVLLLISMQELILCFTFSQALKERFLKRILFFLVSVFCGTSFILAAFIVQKTYQYPEKEVSVLLDLPVHGTWLALHAGEQKWVNYHSNYPPQKFAMDIVKLNEEGRFFIHNAEDTLDFVSFGDSVFAPAAGVVLQTADGFKTQSIYHGEDSLNPAGNYIEIALPGEKYLFLSHLISGSSQVKSGDSIQSGQFLARAGNSGNTHFPHLHMHVQNRPMINDTLSAGLPFRFRHIQRKRFFRWYTLENAYLIRNDCFKN